ncbi:MAG: HD domain-containing protein [Lachnospiraceae bacterium]|nr:HD domain-containing protein [Lachnospiraceae bacterium]
MKITTFAAIYIGSYEVSLKVFEISPNRKIRPVDYVRSRLELGRDAYRKGVIGYELVEELCLILKEFYSIMDGYKVDAYKAYAGNVMRVAGNALFILDQIRLRTKIEVSVISNSEQRFMGYKSLAATSEFEKMIQKGTVVVDVGGGSMQITLFQKGRAVTTQHIELGIMQIWEKLAKIRNMVSHYEMQIQELIDKELEIFKRIYLQKKEIEYVIVMGDYIGEMVKGFSKKEDDGTIETERFLKLLKKWHKKSPEEINRELNLANEQDPLVLPSVVLYKRLTEEMGARYIWVPGVNITDGIVCDYAERNHMIRFSHDFEKDILAASRNLAERYQSYSSHTEAVLSMSTTIFDAMKKVHGMGKRERLLLQVASILHDCGRYMSLVNQSECSYHIIMASEIIGMSHLEREIVATIAKHDALSMQPYDSVIGKMNRESYMVVSKLTAILKIANAMDRSHKQKFKNIKAVLKGRELIITVEAEESIVLEKGLFSTYADSFEEVFSIMPKIREKRVFQ